MAGARRWQEVAGAGLWGKVWGVPASVAGMGKGAGRGGISAGEKAIGGGSGAMGTGGKAGRKACAAELLTGDCLSIALAKMLRQSRLAPSAYPTTTRGASPQRPSKFSETPAEPNLGATRRISRSPTPQAHCSASSSHGQHRSMQGAQPSSAEPAAPNSSQAFTPPRMTSMRSEKPCGALPASQTKTCPMTQTQLLPLHPQLLPHHSVPRRPPSGPRNDWPLQAPSSHLPPRNGHQQTGSPFWKC